MDGWISVARLWLRSRLLPAWTKRDLDNELQYHLDQLTAEFIASGMSAKDAADAAHERFGNVEMVRRRSHAAAEDAMKQTMDEWRDATMVPRGVNLKFVVSSLAILGAVAGFVTGKMTKPLYRAEAVIVVEPAPAINGIGPSPIAADAAMRRVEMSKNVILSRTRLERLMRDFDLYSSSTAVMEERVQMMRNNIDIFPKADRTFSVRFTGENPVTVMKVTEKLAAFFKDENALFAARMAENTSSYLESQIEEVGRRLEAHVAKAKATGTSEDRRVKVETAVLESTYTRLLTSAEEARGRVNMERRQIGEQYILLDAARLPEEPITPTVLQQTGIGTLAGLSLGIVIAIITFGVRLWRGRPPATPISELAR